MAPAWERKKPAQVAEVRPGARVDTGVVKDLPHGRGGDPDPEDQQFAVNVPVAPPRILPCQAKHQQADGADDARPARAPVAGPGRVTAHQQITVPAQQRLRAHQEPGPAKHVPREPVQRGGRERPVARAEPRRGHTSCRSRTAIW
jgi:hypothetical protein